MSEAPNEPVSAATPAKTSNHRSIRRLAFQTLFQLDARGGKHEDEIVAGLAEADEYSVKERERAFALAKDAFATRPDADAYMLKLAPTWPAHRQAAVDRAILRLAYHEMKVKGIEPRIVVNEAVELAKEFSTEKSPAFVNGLLDKLLKETQAGAAGAALPEPSSPSATDRPDAPTA